MCPNINILYVDKESIDIEKPKLNAMWNPNGGEIKTLTGTHAAHCFEAAEPYVVKYSLHASIATSEVIKYSLHASIAASEVIKYSLHASIADSEVIKYSLHASIGHHL